MDCKEQIEKLKNYEARFAGYLKAKYFSDKDIYGGRIQCLEFHCSLVDCRSGELFEEKATIGGMTIRASW
ncbi:hypothetical protein HanOQP8_Chr09g0339521 [Helianthus annuus]|nr:hypothetical protein HanOQP8_Chr09g0339521 [Helianthus annuus]